MQKILLVLLGNLSLFNSIAQQTPAWTTAIPRSFSYKKELEKIAFIPGGTTTIGYALGSEPGVSYQPKTVDYSSFSLWKYETSNQEYRAFVHWVFDSVCRELMGYHRIVNGQKRLDRSKPIDPFNSLLQPLWEEETFPVPGKKRFNMQLLSYILPNGLTLPVYPDTLAWVHDVPFQYNEPNRARYFIHPALNNFPVTGISHAQAVAFCTWKTKMWNEALWAAGDTAHEFLFRLPTAQEWEVAATDRPAVKTERGWVYLFPLQKDNQGPYLYNFGEVADKNGFVVKSYNNTGVFYTASCNSYGASAKGLYHMHGNVSEWTAGTGYLNYDSANYTIVKGGSWNSEPYYLQPAVNEYLLPGAQKATVGFRPLVEYRARQNGQSYVSQ